MDSADLLLARIYGFDKANEHFYLTSSNGRNTSALYAVNIETGERTIIGANEKADIAWVLKNPLEKNIEAFSINYDREEWATTDPEIAEALAFVAQAANGDFTVVNKTKDNRLWMVHYNVDDAPGTYYLIDIVDKTARKVFSQWPKLEGAPLAKMHARIIRARDGLDLVSYFTLPLDSDPDLDGKPDAPVPLVLNVHGGPWKRDQFGFNATHQWLANRGYAVLSVNFRGSHGFGKTFIEAASKEFAGKMHDDLIDAVDWAIATDITTPDQVAIMGESYGGYASLVGLTFTPDRFACGIDIAGPSNLVSFIENMPDTWQIERDTLWYPLVGDPRTEEGRALLESRSPLFKVDEISKPLLILQGAKDEVVSPSEADQIVEASKARGLPVTYALYPDEGHYLMQPETKKSSRALIEAFLAKCLGGEFEPFGTTLDEVNLEIVEGAEHIPGLEQALLAKAEKRSTQQ
jgi:dipeptidyl aminopeptidase/acylaminoacyl peptidase